MMCNLKKKIGQLFPVHDPTFEGVQHYIWTTAKMFTKK